MRKEGGAHAQGLQGRPSAAWAGDPARCDYLAALVTADRRQYKITVRSFTRFCQILTFYPILPQPFRAPNANQTSFPHPFTIFWNGGGWQS